MSRRNELYRPDHRWRRRFIRTSLLCLAAIPMLLLAEAAMRWSGVVIPGDPFQPMTAPSALFAATKEGTAYSIQAPLSAADRQIPAVKSASTFRVLCLGGSESVPIAQSGRTYDLLLQDALANAYPQRKVEVINLSAPGLASYRIRLVLDQALLLEPDLVILTAGNDEFCEARQYPEDSPASRILRSVEKRSRLFQYARNIARRWRYPNWVADGNISTPGSAHEWARIEAAALDLRTDAQQYSELCKHFEFAIDQMVGHSTSRGVPILVLTACSNLHDWAPLASRQNLEGDARRAFESLLRRGRAELLRGDHDKAITTLVAATQKEPQHAEAWFHLANAYELSHDDANARDAFMRAKDLDLAPLRSLSKLNQIARSIVGRHTRAHVVEVEAAAHAAAKCVTPGFDLFVDHVHPTPRGHAVIARTVFDRIMELKLIQSPLRSMAFSPPEQLTTGEVDLRSQITLLKTLGSLRQFPTFLTMASRFHAPSESLNSAVAACVAELGNILDMERKDLLGEPFDPSYRERRRSFPIDTLGRLDVKIESTPGPIR